MRGLQTTTYNAKQIFGSRPISQFHCGAITCAEGGVYSAGTVMAKAVSTGHYIPYIPEDDEDEGDPAGADVARGILQHDVDATEEPRASSLILIGGVKAAEVTGWDDRAAAQLFGREFEGEINFG